MVGRRDKYIDNRKKPEHMHKILLSRLCSVGCSVGNLLLIKLNKSAA